MTNSRTARILFFGDIVGRSGRFAVVDYLKSLADSGNMPDFVIANVENATHGFGLSKKNYDELLAAGINCFTSGNHIWDRKDIFDYINEADKLVRPWNYPQNTLGVGYRIFDLKDSKIAVINFLGRVFMPPIDSPWELLTQNIEQIKAITPNVFVDFHAEATAEKICFAKFCSELGVTALFGTHTHVQTADEKIMNNMAYITDAGFCGSFESVIGMEYKTSIKRLTTLLPQRYEVAESNLLQVNAVEVDVDYLSGKAISIKRINSTLNYENEKRGNEDES